MVMPSIEPSIRDRCSPVSPKPFFLPLMLLRKAERLVNTSRLLVIDRRQF